MRSLYWQKQHIHLAQTNWGERCDTIVSMCVEFVCPMNIVKLLICINITGCFCVEIMILVSNRKTTQCPSWTMRCQWKSYQNHESAMIDTPQYADVFFQQLIPYSIKGIGKMRSESSEWMTIWLSCKDACTRVIRRTPKKQSLFQIVKHHGYG